MMKNRSITIRTGLLAAAIALLVGCSSAPKAPTVELPDPKDVPKEKWSDAMHVLKAMGMSGQRDVPREMAESFVNSGLGPSTGAASADVALAGASLAAPPTGFSGGAAAGVSLGLMLLGGSSDPARTTQVVAWVPTDMASSPEEASALALQKVEEARKKVFVKGMSKLSMHVGKYPDGHSRAYASLADSYAERPIPFTDNATPAPKFIEASEAYGPIFIRDNQFVLDASKNGMTVSQAMLLASRQLPEWIYIYHPGQKLRKNSIPAAIFNQGEAKYFVGK
ncbi:hypothetical protein L4P19_004620 [Pseudomonas aeruginosa]|nr:hypothetical protein [Pseudomonas aeruginosa]EKV3075575.1 hypothetical protein [Pseudomonas aeruginosa]